MMVVLVIENATEKLRGELTRWLMEVRPGTFAGNISALVRQKIWDKVYNDKNKNGALMLYSTNNEQGFFIQMCGDPKRTVTDIEGVQLIRVKNQSGSDIKDEHSINIS